MSSHFNAKSLTFYAVAIGAVLLLFNVVTAYGEKNLKAPKTIGGRYRLTPANNLSGCPQIAPLELQVDQSGNYVNAAILKPADKDAQGSMSAEARPTLTGLFNNQQLALTGTVAKSVLCGQAQASGASAIALSSNISGDNLVGEIAVNGSSPKIPFIAEKVASPKSSATSH